MSDKGQGKRAAVDALAGSPTKQKLPADSSTPKCLDPECSGAVRLVPGMTMVR